MAFVKTCIKLVVVSFSVFWFQLFIPSAFAAGDFCACYYGNGDCVQKSLPMGMNNEKGCNLICAAEKNFKDAKFGSGTDAAVVENACIAAHNVWLKGAKAESDAKSADATKSEKSLPKETVTPILNVPIPNLTFSNAIVTPTSVKTSYLADYLNAIYKYLITISVIIAIVMVMVGGLQYVLASGSGKSAEAKKRITNATTGLVLLLSVYMILYTVNPQLTILRELELQNVAEQVLDSAVSENVIRKSQGIQCFMQVFGSTKTEVKSQLVKVKILDRTFMVHKLALPAFQAAAAAIASSGYEFHKGKNGSGTWNWRQNANAPEKLSLHSFGVAIDFNPKQNGNYPKWKKDHPGVPCPTDMPASFINAMKGAGFRWGGDYRVICDAMHFEWLGPCEKGKSKVQISDKVKAKAKPSVYCCTLQDGSKVNVSTEQECSSQPNGLSLDEGVCK